MGAFNGENVVQYRNIVPYMLANVLHSGAPPHAADALFI